MTFVKYGIVFVAGVAAAVLGGTVLFVAAVDGWLDETEKQKIRRETKEAANFWEGVTKDQRGRHLLRD